MYAIRSYYATETPAAVESPEATVETDGSPLGEEDGGHAGEMEDLVKRIQKKAAPPPGELSLTRATPRVETNPRPQYPALARANHWHGIVQLQVGVSDEGRVERIEVVRSSGHVITSYSIHYTKLYDNTGMAFEIKLTFSGEAE